MIGRPTPPLTATVPAVADVFSEEKRSEVMSQIRSEGTGIEASLYALVRQALDYRWRIDRNRTDLPGKPDLVIPRLRIAFFADGCFFHCCPRHGRVPESNRQYWEPKLHRNVQRDLRVRRQLRQEGFSVWRIWEHELKTATSRSRARLRIQGILQRRVNGIRESAVNDSRTASSRS